MLYITLSCLHTLVWWGQSLDCQPAWLKMGTKEIDTEKRLYHLRCPSLPQPHHPGPGSFARFLSLQLCPLKKSVSFSPVWVLNHLQARMTPSGEMLDGEAITASRSGVGWGSGAVSSIKHVCKQFLWHTCPQEVESLPLSVEPEQAFVTAWTNRILAEAML